jgi:membrane protein implicated in regulation of membrane protease activity
MNGKIMIDRKKMLTNWILKPVGAIIALLWDIFGSALCTIAFLVGIVLLLMFWCVASYYIAWHIADETLSRVCLMVFLVFSVVFWIARKVGPGAWLPPQEAAQAEYAADRLAEKLRDKDNGD